MRFATLATLVILLSVPSLASAQKIGVVNIQLIIDQSISGKRALEQMKKKSDGVIAESGIMPLEDELKKMKEKLEKDVENPMLNKDALERQKAEFQEKAIRYRMLQSQVDNELKRLDRELTSRILKEVTDLVSKVGLDGNYSLIVERGDVLYYPSSIDLTDQVLKAYDKQAK